MNFYSEHGRSDFRSLEQLYENSDVIILASSLKTLPGRMKALAEISNKIGGEKIVFDIATFKAELIPIYSAFSRECKVASVHPMFGPGVDCIKGRRFLVVPIPGREGDSRTIGDLISSWGGEVKYVSAEEHDRLMAFAIGLPYAIGLAYLKLSLELNLGDFGGTSQAFLETYGKAVLNDSPEFIEEVIERSRDALKDFVPLIGTVDPRELLEKIGREEIEEAYRRFYRALG